MIELIEAQQFAKANDGVDAVEMTSDYHGSTIYKLIPFHGYEGLKLGNPILFTKKNDSFVFLSSDEVDDFISWTVRGVHYDDD